MLEEIMRECRNFFEVDRIAGDFCIEDGALTLALKDGQYYRICGSVFNDGVHKYGDDEDELEDETFSGEIAVMAVPRAFLKLVERIEEWHTKYGEVTPFNSESFDGYSYTKASGTTGKQTTWADAFRADLAIWRKC